jgi:hypothetical protein
MKEKGKAIQREEVMNMRRHGQLLRDDVDWEMIKAGAKNAKLPVHPHTVPS